MNPTLPKTASGGRTAIDSPAPDAFGDKDVAPAKDEQNTPPRQDQEENEKDLDPNGNKEAKPAEGNVPGTPSAVTTEPELCSLEDKGPSSQLCGDGPDDQDKGYPLELYLPALFKPSLDNVVLKITGGRAPIEINAQAETPFGLISEFLEDEFKLEAKFRYQDRELGDNETPLSLRMYGNTTLDIVQDVDGIDQVKEMPPLIKAVAIYLAVAGTPTQVYAMIVPNGASPMAAWKRSGLSHLIKDPRFLIDGEIQDRHGGFSTIDLTESVIIDVMPGMIGGGPGDQEEDEQDQAENMASPFTYVGTHPSRVTFREPQQHAPSDDSNESPAPTPVLAIERPSNQAPQVFCGKGVDIFFEQYEVFCKSRNYANASRFEYLSFFLSGDEPHNILSFARDLPEWRNKDYEGVKRQLLRAFSESDIDKFTIVDLLNFIGRKRTVNTLHDLNQYILSYKDIANNLYKHRRLTSEMYKEHFLEGLPGHILEKLERQDYEHRRHAENPDFDQIEDDVRKVFQPTAFYAKFRHTHNIEQDRRAHPEHVRGPNMVPASSKNSKYGVTEDVKALTKLMESLTVNSNGAGTRPIATPYRGDPTGQTNSQPAFNPNPPGCHYCGNPAHNKFSCPTLQTHVAQGIVSLDQDNKMIGKNSKYLPWRPGQMAEIAQQRAAEWDAAHGHMASNHQQYQSSHEHVLDPATSGDGFSVNTNLCEYVSSESFAANNVTTLPRDELHPSNPFYAEVQTKRQATENLDNGPSKRTRSATAATAEEDGDMDEESDLTEDPVTANVNKRKPATTAIRSHASETYSAHTVFQRILDTVVEIPVRELVGADKDLEKEMIRYCKGRKVVKIGPTIHHTNAAGFHDEEENGPFYTHCLPMIKVTINGLTCTALVDTGSEVDMISLDLFKKLGAPLRKDGIHKVVGVGNQAEKLHGVCEGLKLTIGGITNTINVFVRAGLSYHLLIGMPGIRRFNICTRLGRDGQLWVEMKNEEGVKVQMLGTKNSDPRNRQYLPPNWGKARRVPDSDEETSSSSSA
ncbi:hypothetical protein OC844_007142 [Tilletia horrida]|nr:hypothetical protein OC844_007142 [Tilletia horrida]